MPCTVWLKGGAGVIGLGIIGAGRAGELHVKAAGQSAAVRYVGVSEVDAQRREAFVSRYGGEGFSNYQDLLARDDIHLVVVALPHHMHATVACDVAAAGKHVLVEKPMATTLEECDTMIAAAAKAGVQLNVGQTYHFHPTSAAAHKRLSEGAIGPVVMGLEVLHSSRHPGTQPAWIMTAAAGGGQLFSNGIHQVDRALWLTGARPIGVQAAIGTSFFSGEIEVDDHSHLWIAFEGGATASVLTTGYRSGAPAFYGEYVGVAGMLRVDSELKLATGEDRAYRSVPVEQAGGFIDGFVRQLDAVGHAVETGAPAPVPGEWGKRVLSVLLAAQASARTGKAVAL